MPYIIGIAGSVAVGKSTTARVLQALLARWSPRPKVDLVTTDGFLLSQRGARARRPDAEEGLSGELRSPGLLSFLSDIKAGRRPVRAPVYSHLTYDIVPNQWLEIDRPDILIVEGVNVLQTARLPPDGKAVPVVSDFFDFSIYIDADVGDARLVCQALSDASATPRSTIRGRISTAIRGCRTMKRSLPQRRSGSAQISPISRKTSCRRGRARR